MYYNNKSLLVIAKCNLLNPGPLVAHRLNSIIEIVPSVLHRPPLSVPQSDYQFQFEL